MNPVKKGYRVFWSETKRAWKEVAFPANVFYIIYGLVFSFGGLVYVLLALIGMLED